ncbi:putative sensor-like histidine kinase [Halobacillus karajensis]|uniref:Sensor-like histidine kinase n=2 Tax=Halobacillus karajensis TaxID=195088 RepID=A0A024P9P3_9BACI|nr:putative sensor-like histidine kinase [Halobacillus karajensis]CDQ25655.1 putative sensor-like histidine kinase [Halobacillus karajensis]CDQ25926.1 putative sensor-like histidine kinase [Halobacillus karajensis]
MQNKIRWPPSLNQKGEFLMNSIQSRLLLMLLIFILFPYFLVVLLIYGYTKNSVEKHELGNSQEQIEESSEELRQYFSEMLDLPFLLYRDPELFRIFNNEVENSNYLEKSIQNFYLMRKEIRQVRFYMDKNKESFTVYNAMVSARKSKNNFLKQPYIKQLTESNVSNIIEPPHLIKNYNNAAIVPKSDQTKVLTFHHTITDVFTNEFLGVISMDVELSKVAQIIDDLTKEKEESVFLLNEYNQVIYASDSKRIGQPASPELMKQLKREKDSNGDIPLSKTLSAPLEKWRLVKITPSEVLFHEVRQTVYTYILVGLGVGALGLIMMSVIAYKISNPIKRLTRKVRMIDGGHTNMAFDNRREDEIGYLEKHIKDMMARINRHIDREYKLEIENKENQFRALKSQVNPHFLFNTLQSIGAVALRSGAPNVYKLVTSLSKMMRYSMQANEWVLVKEEINYIKAYLSLQMERFYNNINYSITISSKVLEMEIPSMILQPLVENFFKHSYEEGFTDACLTISGEMEKGILHFIVEDDGASLTENELQSLREYIYKSHRKGVAVKEHIGLKNIHDRLVLNYGSKAGIKVDRDQGRGFIVEVFIPIEMESTE